MAGGRRGGLWRAGRPAWREGWLWSGVVVFFVLFVCVRVYACVCVYVCGRVGALSLPFPSSIRRVVHGVSCMGCVGVVVGLGWGVGVCVSNVRVCDGGLFGVVLGLGWACWPGRG